MSVSKRRVGKAGGSLWGSIWRWGAALLAATLVVVAAATAGVYVHYQSVVGRPVLGEGETRTLVIPEGTAWPGVVARVSDAGLVEPERYFDMWGRRTGLASTARAGTFHLAGPMTIEELAEVLRRGGLAEEVAVTFPEGWTIYHIADRIEAVGLASRSEFLKKARDEALLAELGIEGESVEGYLFPDTYRFHQGASAEQVIRTLHGRWKQVVEPLVESHRESLDRLQDAYAFGLREVVIMASLVERETGMTSERGRVARVFYNRLDRGMRLQTDPTCVYGEDTYMEVPHPRYCHDKLNRYSTYVIDGLTPGPIANPGKEAIVAALNPSEAAEDLEFLYFVARRDGKGGHYFSKTYQEHRQAIRKYLLGK
ncbi:endolytic transglycosylase MltG [Lujinxingia litoralis]|uniref:Endolytic murein transglycosylase n=1 Tax=Lujinxingia litoralis TaxID=2211119 RepID=A0A328CBL9_9DELT|nr:endolytic transglycosylase MltG [Lujinxingia litoralis]RAL23517.1 endolytic transglycosylase MltG [Lujinxingia litoralis]